MIESGMFLECLSLLSNHYNRQLQPEVIRIWKDYLDSQLNTEQFQQAIKMTLLESRFFPTAKELVEMVKGDAETQAAQEWELCIKAAARNDREVIAQLSAQGQSALQLVGGLYKLGLATEEELRWLKKEFVAVGKATPTNVRSLSPSANMNAEQTETLVIARQPDIMKGARR